MSTILGFTAITGDGCGGCGSDDHCNSDICANHLHLAPVRSSPP